MRSSARRLLGAICVALGVLSPAVALAQTSAIAGTVKDTSGAVLPGVTVEVSSPALIEKTRSSVTDGSGQYKVDALRPGIYSVTFTLPGFNTVKRDNIELTSDFTAAINGEMKVGAVEETITVSAESPSSRSWWSMRGRTCSPADSPAWTSSLSFPGSSSPAS